MSSEAALYGDPETRRRILQATWELLEQQVPGSSSSMSPTGQGSRRAVYLHFGDRSGLLVALVDYIDVSLGAVQLAPTSTVAPPAWRACSGGSRR